MQIFVELGDHFFRLETATIGPQAFQPVGGNMHQAGVMVDGVAHAGTQYLDGDFRAIFQYGKVHLCNRSRRNWRAFKTGKQIIRVSAQRFLDLRNRQIRVERRHAVLQLGEFVDDIRWQ